MNQKVLAVISGLALSLAATSTALAGECVGTVTAVEGNAITVTCDNTTEAKNINAITVGDTVTLTSPGKPAEKATGKIPAKPTDKAAPKSPAAPAAKKKIEGC